LLPLNQQNQALKGIKTTDFTTTEMTDSSLEQLVNEWNCCGVWLPVAEIFRQEAAVAQLS